MTTHTFSRDVLEEALADLNSIKKDGPNEQYVGICGNIGHHIVRHYGPAWDEFSGNKEYPVPYEDDPAHGYVFSSFKDEDGLYPLWREDQAYGQARWRLVDYLIERITAELQSMSV